MTISASGRAVAVSSLDGDFVYRILPIVKSE